ncbi:UDP-Glycosyltransferase/glycogen phosphorylase [Rhizophagus irregularis]|uniref:UDP-Glycosyltransferase/glycogen phosphorylase n=1 Tax=Rhizophagus irregularis TaxID=588596 RepID=A0A2I1H2W1_9GLOM|nr:UDP-Glycosyltransferase/glycogen phosphorylase [Rhizophagus irregularis]
MGSFLCYLLASGNNVLSSEYPAVKQISLGPSTGMKNLGKDGIDEEQDYNAMKSLWEIGVISYKRTYEKYKSVVEDYNIDLIFCDLLINEACVDVANTLKKPVIVLVLALQIVDPKPYKFDPILGCNISLENESIWERFRCNFIQVFRYVYSLSDFTNQLNEMRKQMNVDLGQLTLGGFKASLVLIDTFFGFELPQTLPPYIQEIGPILSEEYPPLTPELSDFINGHERVLYVSFGTLYSTTTDNNSKLLQSFIEAINKKIIDGVVWALVETPKDYFYPTLKLSDGTQVQTSQILNNEHPHIHIAEFVPQFAILNHGGAGSAHESLYTGTPMLVLPFAGDQMGNAQKLVSAGVASSLKLNHFGC